MRNPFVALLFYIALGTVIIRFARSSYAEPEMTLRRWYSHLPQKNWSIRLLRGFAVFWVFCGVLVIGSGIASLQVLEHSHGSLLLVIILTIAALSTALLVRATPRYSETRRSDK
jgi:hypothetical protein